MRPIDADSLLRAVEDSRNDNPHHNPAVHINHCVEHDQFKHLIAKQETFHFGGTVKMVALDDDEENVMYVPEEWCTITNPFTSASGKPEVDDVDMLCGESEQCPLDCPKCVIQRIFNEYAKMTGQTEGSS